MTGDRQPTDPEQIEALIRRWAEAVHAGDLDTVLRDHSDDIVMFDGPRWSMGHHSRAPLIPESRLRN